MYNRKISTEKQYTVIFSSNSEDKDLYLKQILTTKKTITYIM